MPLPAPPSTTTAYRLALLGAAATSTIALTDAMTRGFTGRDSVFADTYGLTWPLLLGDLVHGLTYLSFAVLLLAAAPAIDAAGRTARAVRRGLVVTFAFLTVGFVALLPLTIGRAGGIYDVLAASGGVAFLLMFLLAFALGVTTLRRPQLRPGAILLVALLPVIGLTVAIAAAMPAFAHPAYAETTLHFGIALLGLKLQNDRTAQPQLVRR